MDEYLDLILVYLSRYTGNLYYRDSRLMDIAQGLCQAKYGGYGFSPFTQSPARWKVSLKARDLNKDLLAVSASQQHERSMSETAVQKAEQ